MLMFSQQLAGTPYYIEITCSCSNCYLARGRSKLLTISQANKHTLGGRGYDLCTLYKMLIGSKWLVLISLCFHGRNCIMHCSRASHSYVWDLQTCTTAATYPSFVLEQHQPSIKSSAVSITTFSMFSFLPTSHERKPRTDII